MALTFKEVPDSRVYLGVGQMCVTYAVYPGTNDYVNPGGYTIQAASLSLVRISSVDISGITGANANGISFETTLAQTNPPVAGLTSFKLIGYEMGGALSGLFAEIPNATNLANVVFTIQAFGYGG